jgi:PilZ domain
MTGEPMIRGFADQRQSREALATLTRHIRVRVLNCSADGCLLETTAPLLVGTVGLLHVSFGGREFDDQIQVVRCEHMNSTDAIYHVGARFLSMTPPYAGTLRYTMRCDVGGLAGWLDMRRDQ